MSSILNQLAISAHDQCIPLHVTFELSLRCNLRCVHCYNFDRATPMPKELKEQELTPPEIFRIIDELAEAGAFFLSFSGGEAIMHPHILDFIRYARTKNFLVTLKSNGVYLTPERSAALYEAGATKIEISMYGMSAQSHDSFTGVKGSFEKTMAGIHAAKAAGFETILNFILHRGNYREVVSFIKLTQELGVTFGVSTEMTARYDGTRSPLDERVSLQELEEIYQSEVGHLFLGKLNNEESIQCACARSVCGISSTGKVYPCIGAPIPSGDLKKQKFTDIWQNSPQFKKIRGLTLEDFPSCKPCPDRQYCQRSSGSVFMNTGNYTGSEEWTCGEAKLLHRYNTHDHV